MQTTDRHTITLRWTLMFRVATREEAERELERAQEALALALRVTGCARYWKIPELWSCDATAEIVVASVAEAVAQSLLLANKLAIGWYVLGPYLGDDGALESFEGIYSMRDKNTITPLLEWAHFEVSGGG
jgi:hypothetical protein